MFTSILAGLDAIKVYLYGAIAALVLGLSITIYIQHQEVGRYKAIANSARVSLSVSNASIADLKSKLDTTTKTLEANQKAQDQKQAEVAARLKQAEDSDKARIDLEKKLKSRPTTLHCAVPKDLTDAWNKVG